MDYIGFALPRFVNGLANSNHFLYLGQVEAKLRLISTW